MPHIKLRGTKRKARKDKAPETTPSARIGNYSNPYGLTRKDKLAFKEFKLWREKDADRYASRLIAEGRAKERRRRNKNG